MTEPITPEQAAKGHITTIPPEVIDTFNALLMKRYDGVGEVVITQPEIVDILICKGLDRKDIFDNCWLDVETTYRKAGWAVEYNKPGYNEFFVPTWSFVKRK